jgi:hypothetical protein
VAAEPVRVLVTGSRTWTDVALVWGVLDAYCRTMVEPGRPVVLVHGRALGADRQADAWARRRGVQREPHPFFSHLGRAGGHARNGHMVSLGADVCLAFIRAGSDGATGCARLAHRAGISTLVWRDRCPDPDRQPWQCTARCRHRWDQEAT